MKIIDNNALTFVRDHKIQLQDQYMTTPDVQDEYEAGFDSPLPKQVQVCTKYGNFDQGTYLQHYKRMLNKFGSSSLYGMRGLGDVSLLSLLHTLKDSCKGMLPTMIDDIVVVTSDRRLTKRIGREFSSKDEFDAKISVVPETKHFP